jgi:hypothetical protein
VSGRLHKLSCIAKSRRPRKDESVETACESGQSELQPAARLLNDQSYFLVKGSPGRVSVCSDRTALNWFRSTPPSLHNCRGNLPRI